MLVIYMFGMPSCKNIILIFVVLAIISITYDNIAFTKLIGNARKRSNREHGQPDDHTDIIQISNKSPK